MRFEFAAAGRILFGPGTLEEIPSLVEDLGKKALLVHGRGRERARRLEEILRPKGFEVLTFSVRGEPTTDLVEEGVRLVRDEKCRVVLGIGGGSVLDTGKAIAALGPNDGPLLDYLEVIGKGKPLLAPSLPFVAIPTTAGTGSEVTRNAVLASREHGVKVSLRSASMLPRLAVVDPLLTHSLPPTVTASTGMDALTQLIEPFLSNASNPLTDSLCREAIPRVARALPRAFRNGADSRAREDLALGSLFSGLALANARLGAVHGLAGTLGGMFPAPHGAVCARLLPLVFEANAQALRSRNPLSPVLDRLAETARLLTGKASATPGDAVSRLQSLCSDLCIPSLSAFGVTSGDIPTVAARARKASSMKGNPVPLTDEELGEILLRAL